MKKEKLILIGGGGHCKSCIEVIELENKFDIYGIIELPHLKDTDILGYPVIGNDSDIPYFIEKGYSFHITMGHMGNANRRQQIFDLLIENQAKLPSIISPLAFVSKRSIIGKGSIIMHGSIINADTQIGKNTIINNKALIEHDTTIKDNCHISTNTTINGNCQIGNNVFAGSGVITKNGISITDDVIIGAGTLVIKSIKDSGLYFGLPIKKHA